VSTLELRPFEFQVYADPSCKECHGRGAVLPRDPIYDGWRWCDCAIMNRKRKLELDR
jgi:hypothetical protein